jgi:hypothetical protein
MATFSIHHAQIGCGSKELADIGRQLSDNPGTESLDRFFVPLLTVAIHAHIFQLPHLNGATFSLHMTEDG